MAEGYGENEAVAHFDFDRRLGESAHDFAEQLARNHAASGIGYVRGNARDDGNALVRAGQSELLGVRFDQHALQNRIDGTRRQRLGCGLERLDESAGGT